MTVPAELIRYTDPIKCLDHGHVRLIDTMGDDYAVVQAARVSYGKGLSPHDLQRRGNDYVCEVCHKVFSDDIDPETWKPEKVGDLAHCLAGDRGLIRYLSRHRHTTPLEMCEIKLHMKMPIFVARQWIRHRTASVNEYSMRYSPAITDCYLPQPDEWRLQSKSNKQGSDGLLSAAYGRALTERSEKAQKQLFENYDGIIEHDVARELARIDLPLSMYTEWYWKVDLHNLLHLQSLRLHPHAQYEIRVFAEAIAKIIRTWVPMVWEAFVDYRLEASSFSRQELTVIKEMVSMVASVMAGEDKNRTLISMFKPRLVELGMSQRERKAFWVTLGLL